MKTAGCSASCDSNQGGEMAIAMAQLQGLDTAGAGRHGLVERVGSAGGEGPLSLLLSTHDTAP